MGIVNSLFRRTEREADGEYGDSPVEAQSTAQLVILVPDGAGIAAYQVHAFSSAETAEEFLESTLRGWIREGTILFWGMTWLPHFDDDCIIEPVVLIKDIRRMGPVYTFSFADLDSAYAFVRHEMKAGLDLGQVSVYWALPARIHNDYSSRPLVTPSDSPHRAPMLVQIRREHSPLADMAEEIAAEAAVAAAEPQARKVPSDPALPEELVGNALGEVDLAKVINILSAKGLRPIAGNCTNGNGAHAAPAQDEGVAAADATVKLPHDEAVVQPQTADDAPDGVRPIDDETLHVTLGDVYGEPMRIVRRTNRDALPQLGDFECEHEEPEAFKTLPHGVEEMRQPETMGDDAPSGIVAAWGNVSFGLDKALDVHVARRVTAILAWKRLSRAFALGARARDLQKTRIIWRNGVEALASAATIQTLEREAMVRCWQNAARALGKGAEVRSGRRAIRHAWLNISWTLEEAAYAANLERKAALNRAWSSLSTAFAQARLSLGVSEAAKAKGRYEGLVSAWSAATSALRAFAFAKRRHDGLMRAWELLAYACADVFEAATAQAVEAEAAVETVAEEAIDGAAVIEMWRFREGGRFQSKEEDFHGFGSPPGRF
ncbi:MAG: hypothetical protein WD904_07175 [Dehalococcoidia bacterium]